MTKEWNNYQAWIAHFDVLGFKSIIDTKNYLTLKILQVTISEVLSDLNKNVSVFQEDVNYLFYADTFVIYSKSDKVNDYPGFIRIAKNFIVKCIYKKLPIRGAVAFGEITLGHDNKIVMGKAFLESYVYGEDQNWLGLILTPSASIKLKEEGLDPIHHGFVNQDIPLRKYSIFDERVYAYKFINGSTNYKCPLLPALEEMRHRAPIKEKVKYENTIRFIEKHYTVHKKSQL
ncbi:MAG: hypothetical protein ACLQBQ_03900 [Smithella sp.]